MKTSWSSHLPDPNDPNPLILYHGRFCPDGFASALYAWMFFGGRGEYVAMDHGDPVPNAQDRSIYILDFSLPAQAILDLEKKGNCVVLLDHHKTAIENLKGLKLERGLIHLDVNKSGARIAWEYFHGNEVIPAFIRFIEDRDLWRWKYPETHPFTAHLDTEPMNFEHWSKLLKMQGREFQEYVLAGEAMDEKFMHLARHIAKDAVPIVFNGESGLMVNAPATFHSMVGAILAERSKTYGLIWTIVGSQVKIGVRDAPGYTTLPLSHAMGGGGHERASAFRIPFSALPGMLSGTLNSD